MPGKLGWQQMPTWRGSRMGASGARNIRAPSAWQGFNHSQAGRVSWEAAGWRVASSHQTAAEVVNHGPKSAERQAGVPSPCVGVTVSPCQKRKKKKKKFHHSTSFGVSFYKFPPTHTQRKKKLSRDLFCRNLYWFWCGPSYPICLIQSWALNM